MYKPKGILFTFQSFPTEFNKYVVQKMEKNLSYWITKKLSLARKFQIYSKVLTSTHVYYSSCWIPSKACYQKLNKLLRDFLWLFDIQKSSFHRVAWDTYYLPRIASGMSLFDYNFKGFIGCVQNGF